MQLVLGVLVACAVQVAFFLLSLGLALAVLGGLLVTGAYLVEEPRRGTSRRSVVALPVVALVRRARQGREDRTSRFQLACFVLTLTVLINWMLHGPVPSVLIGVLALGAAYLLM
jgi:hypothetical protein